MRGEQQIHRQFESRWWPVLFSPVDHWADITRCFVDINVQSGLTVYLPTGHGALDSTHDVWAPGPGGNLCMAADLARHLKASKLWCCPAVHTSHSHIPCFLWWYTNSDVESNDESEAYTPMNILLLSLKIFVIVSPYLNQQAPEMLRCSLL